MKIIIIISLLSGILSYSFGRHIYIKSLIKNGPEIDKYEDEVTVSYKDLSSKNLVYYPGVRNFVKYSIIKTKFYDSVSLRIITKEDTTIVGYFHDAYINKSQ